MDIFPSRVRRELTWLLLLVTDDRAGGDCKLLLNFQSQTLSSGFQCEIESSSFPSSAELLLLQGVSSESFASRYTYPVANDGCWRDVFSEEAKEANDVIAQWDQLNTADVGFSSGDTAEPLAAIGDPKRDFAGFGALLGEKVCHSTQYPQMTKYRYFRCQKRFRSYSKTRMY